MSACGAAAGQRLRQPAPHAPAAAAAAAPVGGGPAPLRRRGRQRGLRRRPHQRRTAGGSQLAKVGNVQTNFYT